MTECIFILRKEKTQKKQLQLKLLIELGYPDSNQEKQDQNLLCYHYTIAQTIIRIPSAGISVSFLLLGYPDSNQEKQDQNLLCYHYTIAQKLTNRVSFFV